MHWANRALCSDIPPALYFSLYPPPTFQLQFQWCAESQIQQTAARSKENNARRLKSNGRVFTRTAQRRSVRACCGLCCPCVCLPESHTHHMRSDDLCHRARTHTHASGSKNGRHWSFSTVLWSIKKTLLSVLLHVLPLLLCLLSFPAVQPIALMMKIGASWNDLPLLVKQMEPVNGTHRITQCKNAIAHYSKIKGYHCRRQAELTFCIVTWWWFNQVLSFTSHPSACRFCRCHQMKNSGGSAREAEKREKKKRKAFLYYFVQRYE